VAKHPVGSVKVFPGPDLSIAAVPTVVKPFSLTSSELLATVDDFDLLEFQLDLVAGDGSYKVVDPGIVPEQAAVGDLQDAVGSGAGNCVDLP